MSRIPKQASLGALALLVAAIFVGCAEQSLVAPEVDAAPATQLASVPGGVTGALPDLGSCQNLLPREAVTLFFQVFARGAQIYRWSGTAWVFVAPDAKLYPSARANAEIGTHYAGPTWESISGSKVVAAVVDRCTPSTTDIQWLLLGAVSAEGHGPFEGVKYIQRLNTSGGVAPATPGSFIGELANVPYTTDYYFYR